MQKRRSGLQKDFSAIFDGVWVPKKPEPRPPAEVPTPEEYRKQMEQMERIMASMTCSKGFECVKSGFKKLCKVENIGDGKVIGCSPENKGPCEYRFAFMGRSFCKCELRYYIAQHLKK